MHNKLSQNEIDKLIPTGDLGKKTIYFDTLTSTFDEIKKMPITQGLTVVCSNQTNGSGRLGRTWQSSYGGVYFTFALVPPFNKFQIPFITIVCALGVCRALNSYTPCQIKWPNDIVCGGKKLCGILTRNLVSDGKVDAVLVGIGINVNNSFSSDLPYAASLGSITKKRLNENKILRDVLNQIDTLYQKKSPEEILNEYKKVCINLEKEVTMHYHDTESEKTGICKDILPDGSMNVLTDDGIVNVHSGEVSVKGIYGQKGKN